MNYRAFTPEEVKKGLFNDLLDYLLNHNKKNNDRYYDIHITTDGYCSIVEWVECNYNDEYGDNRHFRLIDYDEVVMKEVIMPDNSIQYAVDDDHAKELLDDFLKENPNYKKNEYGQWIDTDALVEFNH